MQSQDLGGTLPVKFTVAPLSRSKSREESRNAEPLLGLMPSADHQREVSRSLDHRTGAAALKGARLQPSHRRLQTDADLAHYDYLLSVEHTSILSPDSLLLSEWSLPIVQSGQSGEPYRGSSERGSKGRRLHPETKAHT